MSEFGNDVAGATMNVTGQSIRSMTEILEVLLRATGHSITGTANFIIDKTSAEHRLAKAKYNKLKAAEIMNKAVGRVTIEQLLATGEKICMPTAEMSEKMMKRFEEYAKQYGVEFATVSMRTPEKEELKSVRKNIEELDKKIEAADKLPKLEKDIALQKSKILNIRKEIDELEKSKDGVTGTTELKKIDEKIQSKQSEISKVTTKIEEQQTIYNQIKSGLENADNNIKKYVDELSQQREKLKMKNEELENVVDRTLIVFRDCNAEAINIITKRMNREILMDNLKAKIDIYEKYKNQLSPEQQEEYAKAKSELNKYDKEKINDFNGASIDNSLNERDNTNGYTQGTLEDALNIASTNKPYQLDDSKDMYIVDKGDPNKYILAETKMLAGENGVYLRTDFTAFDGEKELANGYHGNTIEGKQTSKWGPEGWQRSKDRIISKCQFSNTDSVLIFNTREEYEAYLRQQKDLNKDENEQQHESLVDTKDKQQNNDEREYKEEQTVRPSENRNKFNQFDQHQYDFNKLEETLLANDGAEKNKADNRQQYTDLEAFVREEEKLKDSVKKIENETVPADYNAANTFKFGNKEYNIWNGEYANNLFDKDEKVTDDVINIMRNEAFAKKGLEIQKRNIEKELAAANKKLNALDEPTINEAKNIALLQSLIKSKNLSVKQHEQLQTILEMPDSKNSALIKGTAQLLYNRELYNDSFENLMNNKEAAPKLIDTGRKEIVNSHENKINIYNCMTYINYQRQLEIIKKLKENATKLKSIEDNRKIIENAPNKVEELNNIDLIAQRIEDESKALLDEKSKLNKNLDALDDAKAYEKAMKDIDDVNKAKEQSLEDEGMEQSENDIIDEAEQQQENEELNELAEEQFDYPTDYESLNDDINMDNVDIPDIPDIDDEIIDEIEND